MNPDEMKKEIRKLKTALTKLKNQNTKLYHDDAIVKKAASIIEAVRIAGGFQDEEEEPYCHYCNHCNLMLSQEH